MIFLLSRREENTRILCSQCRYHKYDERTDTGRCTRLVRVEITENTCSYVRLASLSRSGGECQMFKPKGMME